MIIYRPHRGSLCDAMEEAKEFNNLQEMKEYIVEQWNNKFSLDDIVIESQAINDEHIGWKDSRSVCIKKLGKEDYIKKYKYPQCIGTCATDYSR
jgi:hypothetical protein